MTIPVGKTSPPGPVNPLPRPLPVEFTLDQCIKCNICLSSCPVSAVTDLFPGPKYAGPQAGRFRTSSQASPDLSVDYCSGCRVCNMVCPHGVKIAEINARARARMVEDGKIPLLLRFRNNLVARSASLGRFAQPLHPLSNFIFSFTPARILADRLLHIAAQAPFPRFAGQRFSSWFHRQPRRPGENGQVVYFHGCATEFYEPWIGKAVVRVLEASGLEVIVPDQGCCGLPLLSNGEFKAARRYHLSNVRHLVDYARQGIPILGTSTSCILTLKEEAPELLDMHDQDTRLVASMTFDFSEFMLQLHEQGRLNTDFSPLPHSIPYHEPCQYRAHRLGNPGRVLMSLIPGLQLLMSPAACCGIAGTYGFKSEKYSIAMQVGEPLFNFVRSSKSPLILCESETCRWQITHATALPAFHPVELLAYAYGLKVGSPIQQILTNTKK